MARLFDDASVEAGIQEAERQARELTGHHGMTGITGRISLAGYRALFTAIVREIDRGTNAVDVMRGFEPLVANVICSIAANTTLTDAECIGAFNVFARHVVNEATGRLRMVRDPQLKNQVSAQMKTTEGGRA
jgi:hypothetical protein